MDSSPRNFFHLLVLLISSLHLISAANFSIDFSSFNPRNFTLFGDSYLREGSVGLTRNLPVPTTSSGSIIYNDPIPIFNSGSNRTASFSARFSFSISNVNPRSCFGDGIVFFLSPDNETLGSPGGYLGLVNSSQLTKKRFVGVEFDTKLDAEFHDPNDHHVGFDVDSLISIKTANLGSKGIDVKGGELINVWVDYENQLEKVEVYVSYSKIKPRNPVLEVEIKLPDYSKDDVYVGFSGATEGSTEVHVVHSFALQVFDVLPERPPQKTPRNDSAVVVVPRENPRPDSKRLAKRVALALVIALPGFCSLVLGVFLVWILVRKRKYRIKKQMSKSFSSEIVTGPRQFSYKELKSATKNFHPSRIIGHGAFGSVYKAIFAPSGNVAAVKRSKHNTHEDKTEFLAELSIIACLCHKNLVHLQGWCVEKGELLLVYDFMPNGSLDRVLYPDEHTLKSEDAATRNPLSWPKRYNIAVGLASVLTYLHQECEQQVIHRDIKTSNVMLDANFNPKLGDFGLARLMDHDDKTPVSTLTAGTMGYLAPEYLQYGTATEKTDVFSYGVVVLELACGRRPIQREKTTTTHHHHHRDHDDDHQKVVNLVDWVWGLHYEDRIIDAVDKRMKIEEEEKMKTLLLVGLSCANPDSTQRPNMRRVLQILNGEAGGTLLVPKCKPTPVFSSSLPLSIEDIVVSDKEEEEEEEDDDDDLVEVIVEPSQKK